MFHPNWRQHGLRSLDQIFDIIVVGGGINGCGIAFDSAQRGLRTLLVEKSDIASGTSSRSSKLVHGGLRYLKQMQFRITRMACRERDRLLNLNPQLVSAIDFLYPAYRGDKTPGWLVDMGLSMYDFLNARPEKHRRLGPGPALDLAPGLNVENLDRALAYPDAMADDARLTLAVAATAHAYGASILTRCELTGGITDSHGRITGIRMRDNESGDALQAEGRVVINAGGVWADSVRERLGMPGRRLRPSRGIHLILPTELIPLKVAVAVASPDDGRPLFFIPHPEGVLYGTTDVYHDGDLDDPRPTESDIDYMLRGANVAFPDKGIDRSKIRGAFAGLRPILGTETKDPSKATRDEDIWEEKGALSVAGGKLTTWRTTAETTVDAALKLLPEQRAREAAPCATEGAILAGLAPRDLASRLEAHGLEPMIAVAMARRLGGLAWHAVSGADPRDCRPLAEGLDLSAAEVRTHLESGAVLHLEDLLIRRARFAMWDPATARDLLPLIRPVVTKTLGWDSRKWDTEEENFRRSLEAWSLS